MLIVQSVVRFEKEIHKDGHHPHLIRSRTVEGSQYPWITGAQPYVAYAAFLGCVVVIVASGSSVWNKAIWTDARSAAAGLIGGYGPVRVPASICSGDVLMALCSLAVHTWSLLDCTEMVQVRLELLGVAADTPELLPDRVPTCCGQTRSAAKGRH